MSYYFEHLSSHDFELLVRDLLQAEWGVRLESFKSGRDRGIDLRYAKGPGTIIVQCKHYIGSGFAKLLADLTLKESPKVQKLAPERYVIATSVGLSPDNKGHILAAISPYCRTPEDVLGREDINNLLGRHPEIERQHFKLWLTSSAVLERVLHNAEHSRTEFNVERVRSRLPLYVQNRAFPRATEILEKTNVVIITGVPGIGKTTLADMLLYAYLAAGYEPVVIQNDVEEGLKLFKATMLHLTPAPKSARFGA